MRRETVRRWGYDETVTTLLLYLCRAGEQIGSDAVSWQLLDYVGRHRPWFVWSRLIDRLHFSALTVPVPTKYAILLNPKYVLVSPESRAGPGAFPATISEATLNSVATLAHEVGHALWNSHGFDSTEEEYYVDRGAARAYWEVLLAHGLSEEEARNRAREKFHCLVKPLEQIIAERRSTTPRHPLKPWTWFDRSRPADVTANIVFLPWINLGVWGHGIWVTNRKVGKWEDPPAC